MSGDLGNLLGAIIGAAEGSVSIHQNVTTAPAIICSSVPPSPRRNRVVYSELNFPSVRYLYQAQPELEVKVVPCRTESVCRSKHLSMPLMKEPCWFPSSTSCSGAAPSSILDR